MINDHEDDDDKMAQVVHVMIMVIIGMIMRMIMKMVVIKRPRWCT